MVDRKEGYIQQLALYVKKNVSKGYTLESLKWALVNQGHSKAEVLKAIELATREMAAEAPVMKEKPVITVETEPPVEEKSGLFSRIKSWFE